MGCPEVEDWETEGSMDVRMRARVCVGRAGQEAVNLPCNHSSQKANEQKGEQRGRRKHWTKGTAAEQGKN